MKLAEGTALLFTPNGQAQAAGAFAAAAIYGGIAGGIIGGGSRASAGPSAAPGLTGGGGGGGGGGTGGGTGQPVTQVVNFTGLFATKQQVGKAMQESQRSLKKTGLATVRGT